VDLIHSNPQQIEQINQRSLSFHILFIIKSYTEYKKQEKISSHFFHLYYLSFYVIQTSRIHIRKIRLYNRKSTSNATDRVDRINNTFSTYGIKTQECRRETRHIINRMTFLLYTQKTSKVSALIFTNGLTHLSLVIKCFFFVLNLE